MFVKYHLNNVMYLEILCINKKSFVSNFGKMVGTILKITTFVLCFYLLHLKGSQIGLE